MQLSEQDLLVPSFRSSLGWAKGKTQGEDLSASLMRNPRESSLLLPISTRKQVTVHPDSMSELPGF